MATGSTLRPLDAALLTLVAGIWGLNFLVIRWGLDSVPPLLFTALRFVFCAVPWVFFLKRPDASWGELCGLGFVLGACVFGFLFVGIAAGVPPGLASLLMQSQVFFTAALSYILDSERLKHHRFVAIGIGALGIAVAATQYTHASGLAGFVLVLCGALSWGFANILLKRLPRNDMLGLMVWISLVPPLPLLALAALQSGPSEVWSAALGIGWRGGFAILYTAILSTIVGYGIWGTMLQRYETSTVAQFSLLVPVFGLVGASVVYGEHYTPAEMVSIFLILLSLIVSTYGAPGKSPRAEQPT